MIIWDDAQTTCQDLSGDNGSSSLTFFKRMMNVGYKFIFADLGRPVTEQTKTALTVASQQYYQMPPEFLFPKSVVVTVGSTKYPLIEEESQEMWDYINQVVQTSTIPQKYFVRPRFGYSGAEIGLWPIPSTAGYTITVIYEATDRDLAVDKYTTGTVTVTADSATITGASTAFTTAMIGRFFNVTAVTGDGMWYKIVSRTSNTVITLENVYEGTSGAGVAYQICEAFNLPEEMQILPVYYALQHYFGARKDIKQESKYKIFFNEGMVLGKKRHATKSRSNIIRGDSWFRRVTDYPIYFPQDGIT